MFFRTMLKINRCLQPNKNSLFQYGWLYKTYRTHVSNGTFASTWANKQVKLSSTYTRNLEQQKTAITPKIDSPPITSRAIKDENVDTVSQDDSILKPKNKPLSIEEQKVQGLQPSSMPNYYTSNMSKLSCFPEEVSEPIRRKFEKSSTQIAMTMPFKLARLANPFPDPVKIQMSNTVSDEEKAMQMQEEAKMEARYRMQQQQEALVRQQMQDQQLRKQQMQEAAYRKQQRQEDIQTAPADATEEELLEPIQMKDQNSTTPQAKADKKSRTRAARYLKSSRNPRTKNQERKYSSDSKVMHPEMLSDIEQCDLILQRLKSLHPEYKFLKRPVCIPGSEEEKEFVKATLKYIAKYKNDLNRRAAPFPSYSEVKTFVREPKIHEVKFEVKTTTDENGNPKELLAIENSVTLQNRKFSSKSKQVDMSAPEDNPKTTECAKFKLEHSISLQKRKYSSKSKPDDLCASKDTPKTKESAKFSLENRIPLQNRKYSSKSKRDVMDAPKDTPKTNEFAKFSLENTIALQNRKFSSKPKRDDMCATKDKPKPKVLTKFRAENSISLQNRKYSSKTKKYDKCAPRDADKVKKCPKFKVAPCADERPTACKHIFADDKCKKTEAPYPSYSECCDDGMEDLPDECKICPYKQDISEAYKGYKRPDDTKKTFYSTWASQQELEELDFCKAKKPPCKNPCKPPECDYAETAKIKRARKGRGSKGPIKKRPKQNAAPATPTLIQKLDTLEIPEEQQLPEEETNEIHVIQLSDKECITIENIPGFMCEGACDTTNKGCPKQKKKPGKSEKKKCRQKKKRPVPTCEDKVHPDPKKKKALDLPIQPIEDKPYLGEAAPTQNTPSAVTLYKQIHVNDQMGIVEPIAIITKENDTTTAPIDTSTIGNDCLPFKLKQQYWKRTRQI